MRFTLYITNDCTLCDQAFDLLCGVPEVSGHILETIDIVSDDTLLERYQEQIPVLEVAQEILLWPFTSEDVSNLCRRVSSRSLE